MAILTSFKRIIIEDFKEADRDVAGKIGGAVNNFADEVVRAFNNKTITITDNLNQFYKDINIQTDVNNKLIGDVKFKNTLSSAAKGLLIVNFSNLKDSTVYPTTPPWVSWTEASKIITINNITGLSASGKYFLRLLVLG